MRCGVCGEGCMVSCVWCVRCAVWCVRCVCHGCMCAVVCVCVVCGQYGVCGVVCVGYVYSVVVCVVKLALSVRPVLQVGLYQ